MCVQTWVLQYKASEFIPGGSPDKRNAMFLWRGANLQLQRKTCENACRDVRAYTNALGNDYKTVYFSCSQMENGNSESVSDKMLSMTEPTTYNCGTDTACMLL